MEVGPLVVMASEGVEGETSFVQPPAAAIPRAHGEGRPSQGRLARLRPQVAIVRALADQVDFLSRMGASDQLGDQLIEELARLGCRLLEEAGWLASSPPPDGSGVFPQQLPSSD